MVTKKATTRKKEANPSTRLGTRKTAPKKEAKVKVAPKQEAISLEPEIVEKPTQTTNTGKGEKYYEAVGRRKESIARVRMYTKKATDEGSEEKALVIVNGKDYRDYFSDAGLWGVVESPLRKLKSVNRFKATVVVHGGGKSGQADAIKHGLARTLVDFDQNFRKKLKKSGFLTRDPRAKERRKYGLKKARKAPRWAKR